MFYFNKMFMEGLMGVFVGAGGGVKGGVFIIIIRIHPRYGH